MTSTSDTGHAKNVANFEELISICTDYGTAYNPSNENLKIQKLQDKLEISGKNIQTVRFAKTVYDNACNAREIAFSGFKRLNTRIINAMEASNVTKQTINDAKTINRKIQGKRSNNSKKDTDAIITPDENTTPEDKTISVSQQSFDNLINNFSNMIEIVSAEPLYTPNETDLNVTELNANLKNLKHLNTAVINTTSSYSDARIVRNFTLYQPAIGLVDIALSVKKYVKSVFGATSPQYKKISGIKFKKIKI